ncbi:MAG: hypothetical protein ACYCYJ_16390 [Trichloromonadaceae bacterium]
MKHIFAIILLIPAMILGGCAAGRIDLARSGEVSVEAIPDGTAKRVQAFAYREREVLVVTGKVLSLVPFYLPGYVDIWVCGPDSNLLSQAQPRITSHSSKRGGTKEARFSAQLSEIPPAGSIVRLRYRASGAPQENLFCR